MTNLQLTSGQMALIRELIADKISRLQGIQCAAVGDGKVFNPILLGKLNACHQLWNALVTNQPTIRTETHPCNNPQEYEHVLDRINQLVLENNRLTIEPGDDKPVITLHVETD